MVRVVTQETYDEVVKENIEEFDMSPTEAIEEAIAQFQAQGVDLSNIIKDLALGTGDSHQVVTVVKTLQDLCGKEKYDDELVMKELDKLKVECGKDIAHRVRASKEGAYDILIKLLEAKQLEYIESPSDNNEKMIVCVLSTLVSLMEMQPDLLEQRGVDLIKSTLDKINNESINISTLKWANTCCVKHEQNRQKIFANNIGDNLKTIIKLRSSSKIVSEAMQLARKFTLDDDVRVEFGKAPEQARELGVKLLESLTSYMKENTQPPEVAETMLTVAALLVRHELCALAADAGADRALFGILADNFDNCAVAMQASKLVTALAGNDDVKRKLMNAGIAPVVVSLINRHGSNAAAAALMLKCVAALSLREPDHCRQFFDNGAPEAIVDCLKIHPDNASVQKNGCWAVRNTVARCREHCPKYLELGAEAILNAAYERFGNDFGFDIKSALRDLECDVRLDEQWTGKGVQMDN